MNTQSDLKINPLSRRPKNKRLVMAVRGAAGVGKSHFAASLADADLGRLCFFDAERKARLLPDASGPQPKFDALENYGCYALDSWTLYFGRKYRQTLETLREQSGDVSAQPSAEQLQADQMIYQEVLRRLCVDSGACVVITDQIAAKGKEDREENELGQVLPMTLGGLEYYVDVMIELSLRVEGFEQVRVARVIKTNSPYFPIGLELRNPNFKDFLVRMDELPQTSDDIPEFLKPSLKEAPASISLAELETSAVGYGIDTNQLLLAAKHYHNVTRLEQLNTHQLEDLLARLYDKYGPVKKTTKAKRLPKAA